LPITSAVKGVRELKVYPDAAHGIWLTHLAQVNADIRSFAGG
jgi:pimeloyl-ACP methyl ester carboxylesterase